MKRAAFFGAADTFNVLCARGGGYGEGGAAAERPDDQTFILMMKVVQTLLPTTPSSEGGSGSSGEGCSGATAERTEICEDLFRTACEAGVLTNAVLRVVENVLPVGSWKRLEACRTTDTVSGGSGNSGSSGSGSPLTVYDLPTEWSSKRREKQNRRRNRKGRKAQW